MAPLARMSVSTSPQTDSELGVLAILLFSMSGLVLLVASLNLANMLLARGSARRKEFAIRLALGGSRLRVVRQLLTEGVALSLVGGVARDVRRLVGDAARRDVAREPPAGHHPARRHARRARADRDGACSVSLSAVLFGLGPAWRQARTDAVPELKEQAGEMRGRRSAAGLLARLRLPTRDLLVMGQLALSLVTLTAAGLFVRAALESATADPGFTFDRGIVANVDPSLGGRNTAQTQRYYEQTLARLRAMPGVQSASFTSLLAFGEFTETEEVQRAGAPLRRDAGGSKSMSFGGDTAGEREDSRARGERRAQRRRRLFQDDRPRGHPRAASSCRTRSSRRPARGSPSSTRRWRASSSAPRTRSGSSSSSRSGSLPDPVVLAGRRRRRRVAPSAPRARDAAAPVPALRAGVPVGDVPARAHRRGVRRRRGGDAAGDPARAARHRCRPCRSCRSRRCRCSAIATSSSGRCAPARTCSSRSAPSRSSCRRSASTASRRTSSRAARARSASASPSAPRRATSSAWCCGTASALAVARPRRSGCCCRSLAGGAIRGLLFGDSRFDAPVVLRRRARARRPRRSSPAGCPARRATRIAATMAMRQ